MAKALKYILWQVGPETALHYERDVLKEKCRVPLAEILPTSDHAEFYVSVVAEGARQGRIRLREDETPDTYLKWMHEYTPNVRFEDLHASNGVPLNVTLLFFREREFLAHRLRWVNQKVSEAA